VPPNELYAAWPGKRLLRCGKRRVVEPVTIFTNKNRMLYSPIHLHPVFLLQKGNLFCQKAMPFYTTMSRRPLIPLRLQPYLLLPQLLSPVHRPAPAHILQTDIQKCLCRLSWNAGRYNSHTDRIPEYPLQ